MAAMALVYSFCTQIEDSSHYCREWAGLHRERRSWCFFHWRCSSVAIRWEVLAMNLPCFHIISLDFCRLYRIVCFSDRAPHKHQVSAIVSHESRWGKEEEGIFSSSLKLASKLNLKFFGCLSLPFKRTTTTTHDFSPFSLTFVPKNEKWEEEHEYSSGKWRALPQNRSRAPQVLFNVKSKNNFIFVED